MNLAMNNFTYLLVLLLVLVWAVSYLLFDTNNLVHLLLLLALGLIVFQILKETKTN